MRQLTKLTNTQQRVRKILDDFCHYPGIHFLSKNQWEGGRVSGAEEK